MKNRWYFLFEKRYVISLAAILFLAIGVGTVTMLGLSDYQTGVAFNEDMVVISGEIKYYDEVLTMSANMMVFTGDEKWEERYHGTVSLLEESIASAVEVDSKLLLYLDRVTNANQKLIEMEEKSFELVHEGKQEEAIDLLLGEEYAGYKEAYSKGLNQFTAALDIVKDNQKKMIKIKIAILILLGFFIVITSMIVFLVIINDMSGRFAIEKLISQTSRHLSQEYGEDYESHINQILEELKNKMKANYIVLLQCDGDEIQDIYENHDGYSISMKGKNKLVQITAEQLEKSQRSVFEYNQMVKKWKDQEEKKFFEHLNIQSYIGARGTLDNEHLVYLGVASFDKRKLSYSQYDLPLIQSIIKMIVDSVNRNNYKTHLYELATIDSLTTTFVRRAFYERMKTAFFQAKRYQTMLSVMMLDLDRFKAINDNFGHDSGDLALRAFAQCVKKSLRESDVFGRIGGEEFCVFLPESNENDAMRVAERIRESLSSSDVLSSQNAFIHITVSIGVTELRDTDEKIEDMIKRADRALYRSKDCGRNKVSKFEDDMV